MVMLHPYKIIKVKTCAAVNPFFGYGVVLVLLAADFYAAALVQRLVPTTVGEYLKWCALRITQRHHSPVDKYGLSSSLNILY